MTGSPRYLPILAGAALAACATVPPGPPPASPASLAAEPKVATEQAGRPAAEAIPAEVMYQVLVAEVAMQRGQLDVAIDNYLRLGRQLRDARMVERAARVAVYAHDNRKALEAAKLWVELAPDKLEARQVATALYIRNGELDAAEHELEAMLAVQAGDQNKGFMLIAGLLGRQQDKEAALQVMRKLVTKRSDDPYALFAYSHLAVRVGELGEAEQAVDRVVELKPDWVEALIQRARVLTMRGKPRDALASLRQAVEVRAEDVQLRIAYARMLVDGKHYEEAYAQFQRVNDAKPGRPDVLIALGMLAMQLEQLEEAESYFLELNHSSLGYQSESSFYLGRIAEELRKDKDSAIKWYSKVDEGETYLDAHIRVAVLLAQQGDLDLARGHLRAITPRGSGQLLRIYLAEGQILQDAGRYQEAMDVFTAGLGELPDNSELLYARGIVAEKLGRLDLMEADLKRIIEREPDNAEALNALGYSLADHTKRYEEALGYIQRALDLRPDSHYILDSMGWVQYRLGHYEEALKYLKRAMALNQDPEIAAHMTEVLWVLGDEQGAREVWDQAFKVAPGNKFLLDVMDRLKK
ncbi:MAG TPA: tetratricopeptide repeat protein [Anaerolineae bacterium]|nr:tetratricopeptide repeat protein [Anaerolineae bacterium]